MNTQSETPNEGHDQARDQARGRGGLVGLRFLLAGAVVAGTVSLGATPAQADEPLAAATSVAESRSGAPVATSTTLTLDRTSGPVGGEPIAATVNVSVPGATGAVDGEAAVARGAVVLSVDGVQQSAVHLEKTTTTASTTASTKTGTTTGPVQLEVPTTGPGASAGEHTVTARFVPAEDSGQAPSTSAALTYTLTRAAIQPTTRPSTQPSDGPGSRPAGARGPEQSSDSATAGGKEDQGEQPPASQGGENVDQDQVTEDQTTSGESSADVSPSVATLGATKLGPGVATIPGFVGYVTASNGELGIGRLSNGRYGVCTDTGAQFPWPTGGLSLVNVNAPRTAYLLSHFMDQARTNPRMAAALWWATGLTFGQNSQQAAMQSRLNQMRAESPGTYNEIRSLHNRMVAEANAFASPAGGYTVSVAINQDDSPDGLDVTQIGVRSGADWVPDSPMTLTLSGDAVFNKTGSKTITLVSSFNPQSLKATQTKPGIVRVTAIAGELAATTYQVWHGGGMTQHVLARADYVSASNTDVTTADDGGRARARKVDAATGDPLQGAAFNVWGETDGNRVYNAATDGDLMSLTSGPGGYTSYYPWFNADGAQVCFRETQAPPGYAVDRTVRCIRPGSLTATVTIEIENGHDVFEDFVPIRVTKSAEGGNPAGIIGVQFEVRLGSPSGPRVDTHTFSAADIRSDGRALWTSGPIYNSDEIFYVVIVDEPDGWVSREPVQQAWLNDAGTAFMSEFADERFYTPAVVTQVSAQRSTYGQVVTDRVVVSGLPNPVVDPVLGHWRLLGPVAPRLDGGALTCAGVDYAAAEVFDEGVFAVTGNGAYVVGSVTLFDPGCYTYVESLDATVVTAAVDWTPAGIVAETTLQVLRPSVVTQISEQKVQVGQVIRDTVTVTGTGGATVPGHWTLYGPIAPSQSVPVSQQGTVDACGPELNWSTAPVAATGDFTVTGDGTYVVGEHTVTQNGCYTYTESLDATPGTAPVAETTRGERSETTIVVRVPSLQTRVSSQRVEVGSTIFDTVMVSNVGTGSPAGTWTLYGPMTPRAGADGRPTCAQVNWTDPTNPAPVAASGTFLVDHGDGDYVVGAYTVETAGCYTYVEDLAGSSTTDPLPPTLPGIPEETTVAQHTPALTTQVSHQMGTVGTVLTDQVFITGIGIAKQVEGGPATGISIPARWRLLGPVEPVLSQELGRTCEGVDWSGGEGVVPVAGQGEFIVTGDGTYVVGEHTVTETGCYTYVQSLAPTRVTVQFPETPAGLVEETSLITTGPRIVTQISDQTSDLGDTITDTVVIEGTEGAHVIGTWTLLGPISPYWDTSTSTLSCLGVEWGNAPTAAAGTFEVMGDGTYVVGEHLVDEEGCYTYLESLPQTPTSDPIGTLAGIPDETTLVTNPDQDIAEAYSSRSDDSDSRDDSTDGESRDGDRRLPNAGAGAALPVLLLAGLLLLAGGAVLIHTARRPARPSRDRAAGEQLGRQLGSG
ncbi:hypothetical protein [Nocardioides hankookensis]|uniref:hypothetical protein n=1 Tax=Nocardioides hankookensis TaxID=443157 RepID=UPI0036D3D4C0